MATIHALALTLALVPARAAGIDIDILPPGSLVQDTRNQLPPNCNIAALAPAVYTESALALAATEVPTQVRVVTIAYLRIAL